MTIGHVFSPPRSRIWRKINFVCAQRLSPERAWNRIVFSGGLAQKIELLRRIIVEKFDVPYRIAPSSEDTLLGLLLLARVFSGRVTSVAQAIEEMKRDA